MSALKHAIIGGLLHLGGLGLLLVGVADSSFLTLPLGNDLLVIVLTAAHPDRALLFAAVATLGSVLGCLITDWASRKGEAKFERFVRGRQRLSFIKYEVDQRAGWMVAVASLMPPPFPFTPFVAGAAAFGYPRHKLLVIIAAARYARFAIEAVLAIRYGRWIIAITRTPAFEHIILTLVGIAIAASGLSIYHWIRESRKMAA